jgi:nitrogen fixation-related uncharacterized protein
MGLVIIPISITIGLLIIITLFEKVERFIRNDRD